MVRAQAGGDGFSVQPIIISHFKWCSITKSLVLEKIKFVYSLCQIDTLVIFVYFLCQTDRLVMVVSCEKTMTNMELSCFSYVQLRQC